MQNARMMAKHKMRVIIRKIGSQGNKMLLRGCILMLLLVTVLTARYSVFLLKQENFGNHHHLVDGDRPLILHANTPRHRNIMIA